MSYPFFAYMSRLKYIARWGLMRSTIPENDAEHTLQTAMIAHALALIRQDIFHEPTDPEHCAMLALYHDASEVFTGDLPTPVKYFTPGLHEKYEEIETEARKKLLATLPEELQESYASYLVTLEQDPLWPLVKAADTLSCLIALLRSCVVFSRPIRNSSLCAPIHITSSARCESTKLASCCCQNRCRHSCVSSIASRSSFVMILRLPFFGYFYVYHDSIRKTDPRQVVFDIPRL